MIEETSLSYSDRNIQLSGVKTIGVLCVEEFRVSTIIESCVGSSQGVGLHESAGEWLLDRATMVIHDHSAIR